MKSIISLLLSVVAFTLTGCETIKRSPRVELRGSYNEVVEEIRTWLNRDIVRDWEVLKDGKRYKFVSEGPQSGRFEIRFYSLDLQNSPPIAVIQLKQEDGRVYVTVSENWMNVPWQHDWKITEAFMEAMKHRR